MSDVYDIDKDEPSKRPAWRALSALLVSIWKPSELHPKDELVAEVANPLYGRVRAGTAAHISLGRVHLTR